MSVFIYIYIYIYILSVYEIKFNDQEHFHIKALDNDHAGVNNFIKSFE